MSWCHIYYITSVILYIYSGYVTASEYYVSAAPNGKDCPYTSRSCHSLSYYIANSSFYFTDDAIFYFLEGTHTLQGVLNIRNISNITLHGLGHIEQGFHETVMQSTSIIRCSVNRRTGIQFSSSSYVVLKFLTIVDCGFNRNHQYSISLYFLDINNVTLEWVSVQNGSGDGVFLSNTYDVLLVNSSFANNITQVAFLANVYIINTDQTNRLSRLIILESNFTLYFGCGIYMWYENNKADVTIKNSMFSHNNGWFAGGVYITLLGGGSIVISNCSMCNNTAQNGGGMYIRSYRNGSIELNNCSICNNSALVNGGGANVFQFDDSSIKFINCIIYNNTAQSDGGGVQIDSYAESGSIEFSNCTISNNTAHLTSGLVLRSVQVNSKNSFLFTNVSFHFNEVIYKTGVYQKGYRSTVALINVKNINFDQIKVSNNNATGLVAENGLIRFDGHNIFVNNSAIYGGGIALYKSSQLLLKQNANISFVNNHASESGGGIFVYNDLVLGTGIATECSFKVIPYHYSNDTKTVLYFVNNTADISGDVLYVSKIEHCMSTDYFDHLFHYPQQTGLSVVSSDPIKVCFCQMNRQNCSITSISKFAIPGIDINVSLATVGINDNLTKGVIKLTTDSSSSTVEIYNNRLNAVCTNVTLKLRANPSLRTTKVYATLQRLISEHLYEAYDKEIKVNIESCPIGYPLVNDTCICRPELKTSSITCNINTQLITRHGGTWIGYHNDSDCLVVYPNCHFDYCNDGTVIFKILSPEPQCLDNRSGLLCGQCSEGFSLMLGSNQCGQCTNDYIALIIPFALAGIALVAFVIVLNLTVSVGTINGLIFYANVVKIYEHFFFPKGNIPFVSQFISWINLDLGIETCFIDGMGSCTKAWLQFIFPAYVWFILLFIIILSQYSSKVVRLVGRQAIPVLATMILLSYTKLIRIVFQVLHYTNIQCSGKNNVTLLRWYIDANVQYVRGCHIPLFLFSVAVLILLIIPYTFYLLTIPLFEGPLSKYMCCCKRFSTYTKPFFDAYGGPYKDKCRFWTGILLLVRIIIALTVSVDTDATKCLDVLLSFLIAIIFLYRVFRGIYRHFLLDYLEEFFILNLMFMAYMNVRTSNDHDKLKGQVSSIVLVSISFVVFCSIIVYHVRDRLIFYDVWDHLLKSRLQQPITKVMNILKKPPPPSAFNEMELPSTDPESSDDERRRSVPMSVVSVGMERESMLFDKDD